MTLAEVVVFPDIQDLLCDYLETEHQARGNQVPAGTKVPIDRPGTFIRVMVVGGTRRSRFIDAPSVVVESWAPTEEEAVDLAELNRGLIFALDIHDGHQVYDVTEQARPTNLPDPKSTHERFTATYEVPVGGRAV